MAQPVSPDSARLKLAVGTTVVLLAISLTVNTALGYVQGKTLR